MTHVTCRLTAKNRDQLRNPTLGNRVWATFTFFYRLIAGLGYGCSLSECDRTVIRPVKTWLRKPERTLLGDPA